MSDAETRARHQRIQDQFTSRAPVYEHKAAWITDAGLLDCFVRLCRAPREAVLLDVCCGTGLVGGAFAGRVARRVGLDLTDEMLAQARQRLDECHQGLADRMPFPDAAFDVVVCRQALHFVDSPAQVLREMRRVLRPGGQAIVGHRVPYGDEDAAWWERVNRKKQPLLRNVLRAEDLEALFRGAGFTKLEAVDYYLRESIPLWMDSPEASAAAREVFDLYREAPPEAVRLRRIAVADRHIEDTWRWHVVSGK